MPIYAYRCDNCGHAKDVLQKVSDPLLTVCPVCGQSTFRKQLTAAGFQLKGSGWYATDFKNGGSAPVKPVKSDDAPKTGDAAPAAAPATPAAPAAGSADSKASTPAAAPPPAGPPAAGSSGN